MALKCSEFAKLALGLDLWPMQKKILDNLFDKKTNHAVWCLGRRSSKSTMAAIAAVYMAFCQEEHFRRKVRKGENFYVVTVANDLKQSKIALDFIRQLLVNSPLEQEIVRETTLEITLSNNCTFQAIPASARASRGKAVAMAIFDECAFGIEGDANRGTKAMFDALSPSIAQFAPHSKILELSSPWIADGTFYEHFRQAESGEFIGMDCL
ncbi:terminase, partial [bacterium]|nr:terminase [bacterium]